MSEIPAPQKPIPQFTIRWLLGLMTVCGVISSIIALAMRGHLWALGISVALGTLVLFMLIAACLFLIVWIFTGFGASRNPNLTAGQSPFRVSEIPTARDFLTDGEQTK
jgi:uncharacterized membrane protein